MAQNPFNNPMISGLFSRISLRTKFILTALIAFWLGMMLRGGSGAGRYQFMSNDPMFVIDTGTGTTFRYSAEEHEFKRFGSLPWH